MRFISYNLTPQGSGIYRRIFLKEITVFNKDNKSHIKGDHPLFFGEADGLYDSINQPYPYLYELMEKLKQLDWSEHDVDLTQTRMDLLRCDSKTREFMLFNLAYQWSLDSIATSIPTLLAPFVTNSEYGHLLARIGENENLHSVTYSNIVRQCVPDPQEVFDMVYKHEEVLQRSGVIAKTLSDLREVGAKFTLGLMTEEECKPYVLKGVVAIYALERISFPSSFSCTFALAEQEYFVGGARLVQKILLDEMIHYEAGRFTHQDVMLKQPEWIKVFEDNKEDIQAIIDGATQQELDWNVYLFSGGRSLVGLNEGLLNEWVRFNAQEVYDNIGLVQPFRRTTQNPLPWFETNWMDLNSQQNANMESNPTNYMVSSVSKDVSGVVFDLGGLIFEVEDTIESKVDGENIYTIYSKDSCPFCIKLKEFMHSNGLIFVEINVDVKPEGKEFLISEGLKTVPQVFDTFGNYRGDCTSFIENYL